MYQSILISKSSDLELIQEIVNKLKGRVPYLCMIVKECILRQVQWYNL